MVEGRKSKYTRTYLSALLVSFLVIALYYSTFGWLYERFTAADSYYSHGFLIPVVSGVLVWMKRKNIRGLRVEYSRPGFYIVLVSILLHLIGTLVHFFFLSGVSLFFFVLGGTLFLFGWPLTRALSFPLLFLISAIPLPLPAISALLFPMKVFVLKTSSLILEWGGLPLYVEGFNVHLPEGSLLIGNPCSGLRSLIAFMAMGALIGYLSTSSFKKGLIIFLVAIPVAFCSNIIRTISLILVGHHFGVDYASPDYWFHDFSGLAVFGLGLAILLLVSKLLNGKA